MSASSTAAPILGILLLVFFAFDNFVKAKDDGRAILVDQFRSVQMNSVPLPWKEPTAQRTIELQLRLRTQLATGPLLLAQSIHDHQFPLSLTLLVKGGQLETIVRVVNSTVFESLDNAIPVDEPVTINVKVDFDKSVVTVNGDSTPFPNSFEDKRHDDDLIIALGGTREDKSTCIQIDQLKISGQDVDLRSENEVKACNVADPLEASDEYPLNPMNPTKTQSIGDSNAVDEVLSKTPELNEEPIKPSQEQLDKSLQEDTQKKVDQIAAQPEILDGSANSSSEVRPVCFPQQQTQCGTNSKACFGTPNVDNRENGVNFTCTCRDGYGGTRCQFSLLPRSCFEAFRLNSAKITEAGPYELDVDGSGPLLSSWAYCNKNGDTVVTHNMPNNTFVRQAVDTSAKYYPISYKLFQNDQLKRLITDSFNCNQEIRYNCNNAPLGFASNFTWFFTAAQPNVMLKQIGDEPDSCSCANCNHNHYCKCDKEGENYDEGVFSGKNAGITFIYTLKNPQPVSDYQASVTLGPVVCSGNANLHRANSITLKSKEASLSFQANAPVKSFEFEFRTVQENIESLATLEGDIEVALSLRSGHVLQLAIFEAEKEIAKTSIMSQSKLNDLRYHRVLVEISQNEIRLSVDGLNHFLPIAKEAFPATFKLGSCTGSNPTGFIGCVRGVTVNSALVAMGAFSKSSESHFNNECADLCTGHSCEQESRCIEHFDTGKWSCKCKNEFIHKGDRCEKNINLNSDVSFHNSKTGFLQYSNQDFDSNPLNSTVIFSVRTDRKQAVLFYAHDQSDNIVQVHLADEYRMVLTLSNYTALETAEIKNCTVFSNAHDEFSDMRWLQVVIKRSPNRTTLSVDEEQCEIVGPILLAPSTEKLLDYGHIEGFDVIQPPQAQGPPRVGDPYQIMFVGGVPRPENTFGKRRKRMRTPIYITNLPALLGCMRGLVIGGQVVNMREGGKRPQDKNAVQTGCYTECDTIVCRNGGHCTFQWENRDPSMKELTACDCSKTSYFGNNCMKDTGITFTGGQSLLFNITESHSFDLSHSPEQTFRFAFAPMANEKRVQRIVTAIFRDSTEFQVTLHANQSINVVYTGSPNHVYSFSGNYSDGYRHFFQAVFTPRNSILVVIDSRKQYLHDGMRLHFGDVEKIRFGGRAVLTQKDGQEGLAVIDAYKGCLSNVDIDFHQNSLTRFKPLLAYLSNTNASSTVFIDEPDPEQRVSPAGECPNFRVPGVLPILQRNVQFPQWEAPFAPVAFESNFTPSLAPISADDGLPWWLWLLVALIVLAFLLCCLFCFCCHKKKSRPAPIGQGATPQEKIPLNELTSPPPPYSQPSSPSSPLSTTSPSEVKDNFALPPASVPLFEDKPDRPVPGSTNEPPLPSKENQDTDRDSMDNYGDDAEDLDRTLSQGFGEERPNVMDKKTKNMLDKTSPTRMSSFGRTDSTPPLKASRNARLTPASVPQPPPDSYMNGT